MAPLVLGLILGDLLDKNLRRALTLSDGDPTPFLTRPISAALWLVTLLLILSAIPAVRRMVGRVIGWRTA
jgi:putative tricarboxylic transport membrane protein